MSGAARRFWQRLTSPEARLNATGMFVLVAIAAGAALLLPPGEVSGDLPGDDQLGLLASRPIKASRDYLIPDGDATENLRRAASAAVRSVYDFDAGVGAELAERITRALSDARAAQEAGLAGKPARKGRRGPSEEELVAAAADGYGDFVKSLQAVVDEGDYRELARLRFSSEIERSAGLLLRALLATEVVPGRELLIADRETGITIRPIDGRGAERELRDLERIPDVAGLRQDLLRLGAGLPEAPGSNSGVSRAALALAADLDPAVRRAATLLAARVLRPSLAYDARLTAERQRFAAASVKPVVLQYARGEKIIGDGERIEAHHLRVFRHMRERARALDDVQVRAGAALFAVLVVLGVFGLARRTLKGFRPTKRDFVFLAGVLLGNLALLRLVTVACESLRDRFPLLTAEAAAMLLPLAAGTMLVRLLRSGESSMVFAMVFAPLAALQQSSHVPVTLGLVASAVAADRLGKRTGGVGLLQAAGSAGGASALVTLAFALFGGRLLLPETPLHVLLAFVGGGLLSPATAALLAPLAETLFGYASEARLARLANLNHPVLKELIIRAPGTYHHSLIVGSLAEAAAREIGANPLLARVGGYYHDLGKASAPLMFGENQKHENRLERLGPEAAAAVVRKHLADGLERADRARLPKAVLDIIRQHHGTRLAGGFFAIARAQAESLNEPVPDDAPYRYPGPKPRSREAALVMLADAVEAASRGLADPAPERLAALVPRVVEPLVLEGQLDECDLSLTDVRSIIGALGRSLVEWHDLTRVEPIGPRLVASASNPPPPENRAARP